MTSPYTRQTTEAPNRIVRFVHRRRLGVAIGEVAALAPLGASVLDVGCGPGQFLADLERERPDLRLLGFDPFVEMLMSKARRINDLATLEPHSMTCITVLETFEHLEDDVVTNTIGAIRELLSEDGHLVVSVPIILGPVVLAKEANRLRVHRVRDYTTRELVGAVFGRPAPRDRRRIVSHKGFDFRALQAQLAASFELERAWFSPFRRLPAGLNSQAFSIWRLPDSSSRT